MWSPTVLLWMAACYRPAQPVECSLACTQRTECPSGFECDLAANQCAPEGRTCRPPSDAAIDTPIDMPLDAFVGCPSSYIAIVNAPNKYRIVPTGATWLEAATNCANEGATTHLLVLSDDIERGAIGAANGGIVRWIGLSDRLTDGTYLAVTDEDTAGYPGTSGPWDGGTPETDPNANCVRYEVGLQAEIEVAICSALHGYICECDALPNDPTNY